jgi:mannose/cellobiose epimerase-like protein (N-acyl-D-glucosamine 2-epimerase family)
MGRGASAMNQPHVLDCTGTINTLKNKAERARDWLLEAAFPLWAERGFDAGHGQFFETLTLEGLGVAGPTRLRVQARQTYCFALSGAMGWQGDWQARCRSGARVLVERGLRPDGGTHHRLTAVGGVGDPRADLYDAAFVIFALAHAGKALQSQEITDQAAALADHLEAAWSHPLGGYLEGEVDACPPRRQNPHMHLLEAFLALYETTGKALWLDRAHKIITLFQTRFTHRQTGALLEVFEDDWSPRLEGGLARIEPGHQFEWIWLLERYRKASGIWIDGSDALLAAGLSGVSKIGIAVDTVCVTGRNPSSSARLWPQTERLKAHLVLFETATDAQQAQTHAQGAIAAADALWRYLDVPLYGAWRDKFDFVQGFVEEPAPASSFYHIALALSELIRVADAA